MKQRTIIMIFVLQKNHQDNYSKNKIACMWYEHSSVRGHNSKIIAFKVMTLFLQLHLVMISKYSKFGIDTFNTFLSNGLH